MYKRQRSNLVNGLEKGVEVPDFIPWWQPALISVDVVTGTLCVLSLAMFAVGEYVFKRREGGNV